MTSALGFAVPLLLSFPATTGPAQDKSLPPGTVFVDGGDAKIGMPVEEALGLIERFWDRASPIAGTTPQATVSVGGFYLMANEVTNEQYNAFVKATGRRPPAHWFKGNWEEVSRKFSAEHKDRKFYEADYWDGHWKELPWEVPKGEERHPVVFVSYSDARAYARWIGMRLPTEAELARAGRGNAGDPFPWGKQWDEKKSANSASVPKRAAKPVSVSVGSFPESKGIYPVYDLVGSVWEWTSSPYTALPGYKQLTYKEHAEAPPKSALPRFDSSERVVFGGCFSEPFPEAACRLSTRVGAPMNAKTEVIGFRCARSPEPGRDLLAHLYEHDLDLSSVASHEFAFDRSMALERWELAAPSGAGPAPPSYAFVGAYQAIAFAPTKKFDWLSAREIERESLQNPLLLGLFYTDCDLADPALPKGLYTIAYRKAGDPAKAPDRGKEPAGNGKGNGKPAAEPAAGKGNPAPSDRPGSKPAEKPAPPPFDTKKDQIVFRDAKGQVVGAIVAENPIEMRDLRLGGPGSFAIDRGNDALRFYVAVLTRIESKAFYFNFAFKFAPKTMAIEWR